jgi:hypothetical protein
MHVYHGNVERREELLSCWKLSNFHNTEAHAKALFSTTESPWVAVKLTIPESKHGLQRYYDLKFEFGVTTTDFREKSRSLWFRWSEFSCSEKSENYQGGEVHELIDHTVQDLPTKAPPGERNWPWNEDVCVTNDHCAMRWHQFPNDGQWVYLEGIFYTQDGGTGRICLRSTPELYQHRLFLVTEIRLDHFSSDGLSKTRFR